MEKIRYLNKLREELNQEKVSSEAEEVDDFERERERARSSQLDWLEIAIGKCLNDQREGAFASSQNQTSALKNKNYDESYSIAYFKIDEAFA